MSTPVHYIREANVLLFIVPQKSMQCRFDAPMMHSIDETDVLLAK